MVIFIHYLSPPLLLGLKKMSSTTGWYSLAEAQFKIYRYADSATSCSQGIFNCVPSRHHQYLIKKKVTKKGLKY